MTTLSLPTHIHHIPPHLFRSLILSVVFYSFQYRVLAYLLLNLFLNIRAILDCNTTFVPEISYWPLHNLGWHSPPWGRQTQLLELLLTAAELAWGWGWAQQVLPDPSLPLPPSNHLCHCLSFYSSCYCHQREHHKGNLVAWLPIGTEPGPPPPPSHQPRAKGVSLPYSAAVCSPTSRPCSLQSITCFHGLWELSQLLGLQACHASVIPL